MMTCERTPNYAVDTLDSIFSTGPDFDELVESGHATVAAIVDGQRYEYLGDYLNNGRIGIDVLDDERRQMIDGADHARRIAETCFRCIESTPEGADLLLIQDDVEFASDWVARLIDAIDAAEARRNNDTMTYALALYAAMKGMPPGIQPIVRYKPQHFYGTQAVYLPAMVVPKARSYFATHRTSGAMDDMIMKRFFIEHVSDLYAVNPNVVQHVGGVSTHGGPQRSSPSFRR